MKIESSGGTTDIVAMEFIPSQMKTMMPFIYLIIAIFLSPKVKTLRNNIGHASGIVLNK